MVGGDYCLYLSRFSKLSNIPLITVDMLWIVLTVMSSILILLYSLSFDRNLLSGWLLSGWLSVGQGIYFKTKSLAVSNLFADIIFNQPLFNFVSVLIEMSITGKIDLLACFACFIHH